MIRVGSEHRAGHGARVSGIIAWALLALLFWHGQARAAGLEPRNEETLRAILKAAGESNRDVRDRVAWVIGRIGRRDTLSVLEELAQDEVVGVRAAALTAMTQLLPAGSEVRVKLEVPVADRTLRIAALNAARHLRFERREALLDAALASGRVSERILAVRALALDAPETARERVLKMRQDSRASVRAAAVSVLGHATDDQAVQSVLDGLKENSDADSFLVRAAACESLARMKTTKSRETLYKATEDEHYLVRRSAVEAIAALHDGAGVPAVQRRITEADYTVRVAACNTLGKVIDPTSPPLLAARLDDDVPEVRQAADDALKTFPPDLAYKALLEWIDYRGRKETRQRVWRLLGEYAHPGTREAAFTHLDDDMSFVQIDAFRILRKLKDRRIIPRAIKILTTPQADMMGRVVSGGGPMPELDTSRRPLEGLVEEAFKAGAVFKLREGIGLGIFIFKRSMASPMDMGYMPRATTTLAVADYFVALDVKEAIPVMEAAFRHEEGPFSRGREYRLHLAKCLEALTGKSYPVPPAPKRPKPVGVYFIDIRPESEDSGVGPPGE